MGGSYRQCSECGKRALSIATRCPGCGRELEPFQAAEPGPAFRFGRHAPPGLAVLAVLAAVVVGMEMVGDAGPDGRTGARVSAETGVVDSGAESSEVAYALGATAHLDSASVEPTPEAGELLVARTWTNVRRARTRRGELEAVLTPGDTVYADSLLKDWYRVAFQGEVMGYAHRTTLTTP